MGSECNHLPYVELYPYMYLTESKVHSRDYNTMTHIEQRLAERNIAIEYNKLLVIAKHIGNTSAAILLGTVPAVNDTGAYRSREESNGDLVVLIVRNGEPKTIMYRRSNQPFTPEAMNVRKVFTL